jgi:hypothetical protein
VALTPEQIRTLGITPQPDPVKSSGHGKAFIEQGLEPAAQLEAVPPDTLTVTVRQAVESVLDLGLLAATQELERQQFREVQATLDVVNEALRETFGLDRD